MELSYRFARLLCVLPALAFVVVGCANYQVETETLHQVGITAEDAPGWVKGIPGKNNDPSRLYFVGRGIGFNVLDERGAYDAARDHALEQLGRQLYSRVVYNTKDYDGDLDVRFLPDEGGCCLFMGQSDVRDTNQQWHKKCATISTDALAGRMAEEEVYWERWEVIENPERPFCCTDRRMTRWKCWVLMSVSQGDFDDLAAATLTKMKIDAATPAKILRVAGK